MTKATRPHASWKAVLISIWLAILALNIWANLHVGRRVDPQQAGTIAAVFGPPDQLYRLPILALGADSPLLALGAKPGDRLVFDHASDVRRDFAVGESIGVSLFASGRAAHVELHTVAREARQTVLAAVLEWSGLYIGFTCAILIGLRRADSFAMRTLVMVLLSYGFGSQIRVMPGGGLYDVIASFLMPLAGIVAFLGFLYFSLNFPEDRSLWRSRPVRLAFLVFAGVFATVIALHIANNCAMLPWALRALIPLPAWETALLNVAVPSSLAALGYSWSQSAGLTRRKLAWISISMGMLFVSFRYRTVNAVLGSPLSDVALDEVIAISQAVSMLALVYALLRHRLFDFGFALNRALLVTVISGFLLIVFSLTEWGVDKLLHFQGREKNIVFDAAVALAIILCFHRIQHWISHQIDHVFFHQWYAAAEKLRQFMKRAPHISDPAQLQAKFIGAIEAYSSAEGAAMFQIDELADCKLLLSTLPGLPAVLELDHEVLISLRTARKFVYLGDCGQALPGELAFPIITRGSMSGLVVVGAKPGGQPYRPDELALLDSCVGQVGLDLEGLRVAEMQRRAMSSEHKAAHLEQRICDLERLCSTQAMALKLSAGVPT
ncbi:MAG: hypothetical protein V4508_15440 [Pseudomonadota bacterium]